MMEPALPQRQRSSALCPEWPEAAKKGEGFLLVIRRPRFVLTEGGRECGGAGGGKMCWSVKRSLIVQVLQLRGLDREEVQGCTDEAVRVFEELIMQVPSCLAEAQKWGLEGLLKAGFPGQPFTYAAWHTDTHCLPCAPSHPHRVRCLTGRSTCVRQPVH